MSGGALRSFTLVPLVLGLAGCADAGVQPVEIGTDEIEALSDRRVPGSSDDPASGLTEIVGVFERGGGTLIVDVTPPFIRWFEDGRVRTAGAEGEGPGELVQPWRAALSGDTLYVVDSGRMVLFDAASLREIGRRPVPGGVVAVQPGCADRILYAMVVRTRAGSRYRLAGVRFVREGTGVAELGEPGLAPAQFNPTGLNLTAARAGDSVMVVDPIAARVRVFHCASGEVTSYPIPVLEERAAIPTLRGVAHASSGALVFATKADRGSERGTDIFVLRGGDLTARAHGRTDLRIHPGNVPGVSWLVLNGLQPRAIRVNVEDLVKRITP